MSDFFYPSANRCPPLQGMETPLVFVVESVNLTLSVFPIYSIKDCKKHPHLYINTLYQPMHLHDWNLCHAKIFCFHLSNDFCDKHKSHLCVCVWTIYTCLCVTCCREKGHKGTCKHWLLLAGVTLYPSTAANSLSHSPLSVFEGS